MELVPFSYLFYSRQITETTILIHTFRCRVKACIKLKENRMAHSILNSLVRLLNNDAAGVYWLMKFR